MKPLHFFGMAAMRLSFLLVLVSPAITNIVSAQGTAFTYQGRLNASGTPANGSYDLSFTLYNAATNGTALGTVTNAATPVSSGLFTVTLNFGGVFTGTNYWLGIAARTNGSATFVALSPYQPLTPAPYAVFSANAGSATTATTATVSTNFSGFLAGDVTGFQGATTVTTVGGVTAVAVAGGASAANAATSVATANAIVKRDGTGSFSASNATLSGNLNLAGVIYGNGAGLTNITAAQIGAIPISQQAVLTSVATNEDALLLHTNNTFSYHGVNYYFPMTTTACLAEIDSLFPKASNGVPSGISIRLDDNAEYELTSFVTLSNNYKIVGGGPWTTGFCYRGPTNVCNSSDVMAAWQIGANQVFPNVRKCTFINFFPSSFPNWTGAFGVYQSANLILEDFYVKTAQNFPCILMAVQGYDFYATRVGWYGSDVISGVAGNFAQTFPMNLGDIPAPPAAVGLFTEVINQETIDDCTAYELADGIVALGNTWLNCRDFQAEDIGEFPVYPTTNRFGVGFGLYISGNIYKAVVDSYAPYQNWVDIWVDGTDFTPPVINDVIGGQDLQYGICVSGGNSYDTVLNYSFNSMPINEINLVGGSYVVSPASSSTPIISNNGGLAGYGTQVQTSVSQAALVRKP